MKYGNWTEVSSCPDKDHTPEVIGKGGKVKNVKINFR